MQLQRISERVWTLFGLGGDANASFVTTGAGVVVFDTGSNPDEGRELRSIISECSNEPVVYVVNSHYHGNHSGGNEAFGEDCTFLFHKKCHENLVAEGRFSNEEDVPAILFTKGAYINLGGLLFEFRNASGHAPGSLVLNIPQEAVVLAGDLLFVGRVPGTAHSDLKTWNNELAWLGAIKAEHFIPGHGGPGKLDDILAQRQYLSSLLSSTTMMKRAGVCVEDMLESGNHPLLGASPSCPHHRRNLKRAFLQVA